MDLIISSRFDSDQTIGHNLIWKGRLSKTGRGFMPKKLQGTHYSYCARVAARSFAAQPITQWVDYRFGSEIVRVLKID